MEVTVRFFGPLREATGHKELQVSLAQDTSVEDLLEQLARDCPALEQPAGRLRVAVNQVLTEWDAVLRDGDEVAFLPPVSGGAGPADARCTLSSQPLDVGAVLARVAGPDAGGLVAFLGTVRADSRGHEIRFLEYEAYAGMAEAEMQRITAQAAQRWPGVRVAVAHRTGHLAIGEVAVVVAAAAPHREEAFSAARFTIDQLKQRVPIWKKEVAQDGAWWVEDHA